MERQKDLSLRRGESISHVRMDAVNKETIDHYFSLLKDTLEEHNLLDKPGQIYVDESGLPLDPKAPNIITQKVVLTISCSCVYIYCVPLFMCAQSLLPTMHVCCFINTVM